jgi:hypothetical protein
MSVRATQRHVLFCVERGAIPLLQLLDDCKRDCLRCHARIKVDKHKTAAAADATQGSMG